MSDNVTIKIGAQDNASRVLDAVSSKVGGMSSALSTIAPVAAGVTGAIAAVGGAFLTLKAGVEGVLAAAERIDVLADKAAGLGESVGSLQEFQFALNEAGNIDADKSIMVLEKLSATIGNIASGGNKEGAEVLKKLGLDAEQLSLEGPIAQFEAVQDALANINNASERAATAQKIFGKAALELLPALSAQSESMRESMEYAKSVNAAIGDDGASAVAAMNDAIGRVSLGFEGIFNTVAIELAPVVESIASTIAEYIPPLVEMTATLLPELVDGFAYVADNALAVAEAVGLIARREKTLAQAIDESRKNAAKRAEDMAQKRSERLAIKVEPEVDKDADKAAKAVEKTIADLEKKLNLEQKIAELAAASPAGQVDMAAIEKAAADQIAKQEDLASATNEAERKRIAILHEQLSATQAINAEKKVQEAAAKKSIDAIKAETDRIKEQQILLEKGTEAARRFALEQKGIDSQTAKQLAAQQERIDQRKQMVDVWSPQQATQGRLLTMGPVAGQFDRLLGEARKQSENQRLQLGKQDYTNSKLDAIYRDAKNKTIYLETLTVP